MPMLSPHRLLAPALLACLACIVSPACVSSPEASSSPETAVDSQPLTAGTPACSATVEIDPTYVGGAAKFQATVTVTAHTPLYAGWGLQLDIPEGGGPGDTAKPYAKSVSASPSVSITTHTSTGHYELRGTGASSALDAGAKRTFTITVAGKAATGSGYPVPGLHAPHNIKVHQTKSNGSEVFNGKLYDCPIDPLFDHFAFGRTLGTAATDDDGTANPPVYASRNSDFILAPGYINISVKNAKSQVDLQVARILKEHKVPYAYTYTSAFQAQSGLSLRDCNVDYSPTSPHTLCERGATWVRANAANLKKYYTDISTQLQALIDTARAAGEAGAKKLLLHVEPDWIQYSLNGPMSFEPGLVNGLPDQSCHSATVRDEAADGTSTPGSVRKVMPGQADHEFEQRFLWRSVKEDANYQSYAYFSYQYDSTTKRCRLSDNFLKNHPEEKALTIAESKTILQSMLRTTKEHCRDCVLVMDASTKLDPNFMNQVLEGLEEDMVPFVGITGGVISPHSGPYNALLGNHEWKRSFADYNALTGKGIFVITNMGATDFQRAWIEKNTIQAMWNSGVAGVLVSARPEYETFMTPGSPTHVGPVRDQATAPSPTTPSNWYPGWDISLGASTWGSFCTAMVANITAPPGFKAKTVELLLPAGTTPGTLKLITAAEKATATFDANQYVATFTEIPANGSYSSKGVNNCKAMTVTLKITDDAGHVVHWQHHMSAENDVGTFQ